MCHQYLIGGHFNPFQRIIVALLMNQEEFMQHAVI